MNDWNDVRRSQAEAILDWAGSQPWSESMRACRQDAEWHSEGDVWTHTRMVAAEVEKLPEWTSLERDDQLVLLFAAIFHDAGKPATTEINVETGRVHSPNHAKVGMSLCRRALRELGCPLERRE